MNPMKTYKLGRRRPIGKPALQFSRFWTGYIPPHPTSTDYLSKFMSWRMLGNDNYGDCVAAMAGHLTRHVTGNLGAEYYPTLAEVLALYKTQNPGFDPNNYDPATDNGMVIQTMLEYWNKNAWAGRKIVAFAQVDTANPEQAKAALAIFGDLCLGIWVLRANETQFDQGRPWDYVPNSANLGGHGVLAGDYLGQPHADIRFVTWAQVTCFTDAYWKNEVEEAWLVIFEEHFGTKQFVQGVDLNALKADYKALTGRNLPVPTPPPPPLPDGCWLVKAAIRRARGR